MKTEAIETQAYEPMPGWIIIRAQEASDWQRAQDRIDATECTFSCDEHIFRVPASAIMEAPYYLPEGYLMIRKELFEERTEIPRSATRLIGDMQGFTSRMMNRGQSIAKAHNGDWKKAFEDVMVYASAAVHILSVCSSPEGAATLLGAMVQQLEESGFIVKDEGET